MTAHRQRRQDRTHRRPPESFEGAPDGDKGREGERTNGTEHTAGAGAEDKRREERQEGERNTDGHAPGEWRRGTERDTAAEREQGENGQTEKKEIHKYLRERRRGKTPLRLANTCKCVCIHFTEYRGVLAVYCTFFYIYRGEYIIYIYI